ncbi:hypothetical protein ACEPAF_501 [Sanghuangporus sanghuang]
MAFAETPSLIVLLCSLVTVFSSPVPVDVHHEAREEITTLSSDQVTSFKPYTYFAAVASCEPSVTLAWSCGAKCDANSGFTTTASGGDGGDTQFWYVGYDPSLNTVVVGHQGTDADNIQSILVDADFFQDELDQTLFPGIDTSIKVHNGFSEAHARAAPDVLAAVQTTLADHSGASVTTTGHSLGAALALLDAVYLRLHLPSSTVFKTVGYGMPRVGNQEFADYVDAHVTFSGGGLSRINNQKDPIPILPGRGLGFHHPSGEIHIQESNAWDACPGQDNTDERCTVGAVPNIFVSDSDDHSGPYDSIVMGCT